MVMADMALETLAAAMGAEVLVAAVPEVLAVVVSAEVVVGAVAVAERQEDGSLK